MEVGGRRTGPFSTDQVLGLLADGEIPADQPVTTESLRGAWIPAKEVAQHSSAPAPRNRPFSPPPRPTQLSLAPSSDPVPLAGPGEDPAMSLFETLQAARERKAHAIHSLPPHTPPKPAFRLPSLQLPALRRPGLALSPKAKLYAAAGLGLALVGWSAVHFLKGRDAPPGGENGSGASGPTTAGHQSEPRRSRDSASNGLPSQHSGLHPGQPPGTAPLFGSKASAPNPHPEGPTPGAIHPHLGFPPPANMPAPLGASPGMDPDRERDLDRERESAPPLANEAYFDPSSAPPPPPLPAAAIDAASVALDGPQVPGHPGAGIDADGIEAPQMPAPPPGPLE